MSSNSNPAPQQQEDYVDKGLDQAEKKFGGAAGQNTEKNRGVNEKVVRTTSTILYRFDGILHGAD